MATRQQQTLLVFDEERRLSLVREGVPFSKELTNAVWAVSNSAVILDNATFQLAAVAGSGIVAPQPSDERLTFGMGKFEVGLRLASMDTGALPFSVRLEYYSNSILQNFTILSFTELGKSFSFLRSTVLGANVDTFFPEFRIVTNDSGKAATLELQRLFVEPSSFARPPMIAFPKRVDVTKDSLANPVSPVVVSDENTDLVTVMVSVENGALFF